MNGLSAKILFLLGFLSFHLVAHADADVRGGAGGVVAPVGGGTPVVRPVVTPTVINKDSFVNCTWLQDSNVREYLGDRRNQISGLDDFRESRGRRSEMVLVRLVCELESKSEVEQQRVLASVDFPQKCAATPSDGACLVSAETPETVVKKGDRAVVASALFMNAGFRRVAKLKDIPFSLQTVQASPVVGTEMTEVHIRNTNTGGLQSGVNIGGNTKSTDCQIFVTGATGEYLQKSTCSGDKCTPSSPIDLESGKLIFRTEVKGAAGALAEPAAVEWSGGPDKGGIWDNAPVDKDLLVRAVVTMKDESTASCAIRLRQMGKGYYLKLKKYGDCPYFRSLRDYYYLNAANTGPQTGGYPTALQLPGFDIDYGASYPDIPFRGILNVATDVNHNLKTGDGALIVPPIAQRPYSQAVVVARTLQPKTQKIGDAVYYGILNPENYENVQMRKVGEEPADDTLLVYQFFLAAKEMNGAIDARGDTGTKIYEFKEAMAGRAHDRLVPVVNESCMPVFQIQTPRRADKAMPSELKDAVTCAFSRPFTAGDLKRGRVAISVMHFVAEAPNHLFPTDLLAGGLENLISSTTSANRDMSAKQCWKLYPTFNTGNPTWTIDLQSGTGTGQAAGFAAAGMSETTKPEYLRERSPGDECSVKNGVMGFRYSGEAIRWGFGFATQVKKAKVGTIQIWNSAGIDAVGGYLVSPPQTARLSTAPAYQIRQQTIAARHWGHATVNLLNPREGGENGNATLPGGNVISAATAPICPGSQFKYDNVSTSWSPLILDIAGHGIRISREFTKSVSFDMRGDGIQRYVDWPENTKDVAFLVLPDARGAVRSVRQLFGDDKFPNGFDKLKSLAAPDAKAIDAKNPNFRRLRVWFDRNRDGIAQKSELEKLEKYGVRSISLEYRKPGIGTSVQESVLAGEYFDGRRGKFKNIEDHYFTEYQDEERYRFEGARLPSSDHRE